MGAEGASRYRVLADIGQGGMGRVSLAEDAELHRKVALKFLTPTIDGDEATRRRLLREAQAAAHLDHPFICKVYEVGEHGEEPFIAMEYLEGETLKERLKKGPLAPADALRLGAEIAEALDCAQTHGIVHRDLKPANVMLTRDGHVKVMDFGIAKRARTGAPPGAPAATTMTGTDVLTGTLAYMSPEQLRGDAVDSRSDIFATRSRACRGWPRPTRS
jgi:serine/threonine protein kinase